LLYSTHPPTNSKYNHYLYAATAILFLSSAQAQQIQSPTAALTTFVPTEGSADGEKVVAEALEATSMSMQTAQIIGAFGGYGSKSSKTGGHGYGGHGYGGYDDDSKSAKGSGYGSAKSGKGGYSAVASTVEVEETSAPDVPDVDIDEIVGYLSSLLTGLLDAEGQADAVKPATSDFDMDAISDVIEYFLNGYGSKSSKSKSGKRF